MLEVEFREWLETRGAKTQAGLNSRIYAVKTIEKNLAALGSPHADLDAAYKADGFAQLRKRIKQIRIEAKDNSEDYRLLMPVSEQPLNRLSNWNSWLGQYGRFLGGDDSQADEIRDYVLENYIIPARERGDSRVTVVVGPLNTEMGLNMAWPNICQALDGQKFQELADIPPPVTEGPKKSTTRKYTFILTEGDQLVAQTKPTPTNLIFYGPPGTGKTYHTAKEAVALCDGEAAYPESKDGRVALMARYNELMAEKRIAFVTFHQSYDYETFVEGLRPEIGESESSSAGFRLVPTQGLFREICALADQARIQPRVQTDASAFQLSQRRFWKMGQGAIGTEDDVYEEAQANGYIALGWGGNIDWSEDKFSSFNAIHDEWIKQNPENKTPSNWTQTYPFRSEMKPGDIVIVPYGNTAFRAIAEVTGDYYFAPEAEGYYAHRRPVRWLLTLDEPLPLDTIVDGNFTMRTLYSLPKNRVNLPALGRLLSSTENQANDSDVEGQPEQFVLIIDEINRANISKVFGELITLIEPDKRLGMPDALTVTLPYSKKKDFGVPANLHIIGTMNTADRSIALLDTALRRRFNFREMAPDASLLSEVDGIDLTAVLTTINQRIEYLIGREYRIGHAFLINCETREQVEDSVRNKIIPLLQEYFFEDWSRIAAVLGDGFMQKDHILPPPGIEGEPLSSWLVRAPFRNDAFDRLVGKTRALNATALKMAGESEE
ncbi:ATPase AAA [Pectobacterium brasiliense]|uniref:AAA family ATPase n=1 Tax=Pectobacterium TaxID=122277 RepID=UPI0004E76914|nr:MULTISPECIES: AAA family ATPase [Pectobacterium]KFF64924.1 ATPase AAA [Pectobacterium brasiliense]KHT01524.1 ATPase AAA [Pectobacterium brasiliense]RYC47904.1 AAA family ATPase [Pectobacterium zantedeschiae]